MFRRHKARGRLLPVQDAGHGDQLVPRVTSTTRVTGTTRVSRSTSISLSADDLAALGRLLAVGQAVTQERPAVLVRLKAAMTRVGVRIPHGL